MSLAEIIVLLLIVGVCGSIARAILGDRSGGFLATLGVGLVGALLGRWLGEVLELPRLLTVDIGGESIDLLWTILGAVCLLAVLSLISRDRRKKS